MCLEKTPDMQRVLMATRKLSVTFCVLRVCVVCVCVISSSSGALTHTRMGKLQEQKNVLNKKKDV